MLPKSTMSQLFSATTATAQKAHSLLSQAYSQSFLNHHSQNTCYLDIGTDYNLLHCKSELDEGPIFFPRTVQFLNITKFKMNYPFNYPSFTKILHEKINDSKIFLFLFYDKKRREKWNPVDKIKALATEKAWRMGRLP